MRVDDGDYRWSGLIARGKRLGFLTGYRHPVHCDWASDIAVPVVVSNQLSCNISHFGGVQIVDEVDPKDATIDPVAQADP